MVVLIVIAVIPKALLYDSRMIVAILVVVLIVVAIAVQGTRYIVLLNTYLNAQVDTTY